MLRKEILRVSHNKSVWERKVVWRRKPLDQLSPSFQAQVLSLVYATIVKATISIVSLKCYA